MNVRTTRIDCHCEEVFSLPSVIIINYSIVSICSNPRINKQESLDKNYNYYMSILQSNDFVLLLNQNIVSRI